MATLWKLVLVVSPLVLSAPQRCSGVDHGSLELRDVKLLDPLQTGNESLKFISDTIKEGLRLHENNSQALKDLQLLPEMVLMVKEQMNVQNGNIDSLKKQLTALQRVRHLEESVAECQQLVSNHTNTEQLLSNKVQVLEKTLMEHQKKVKQLEKTLMQPNNTVAAQENYTCSALESQPRKQEIIRLVQQFNHTKDWESLRRGLEAVLDHSGEPYIQLQRIEYGSNEPLWYVGSYGSTQLLCLLLEAGLPVDTADADGNTLLHAAAQGGHLQLVKLLLDHGASVNAKGTSGSTPLTRTAIKGHLEVVQLLVSAGADTTAADTYNLTALVIAREWDHPAVVQYLQQFPH